MIAVMVARRGPPEEARTWEIDTWLMSCRVLGRKVEDSMLAHVVAAARTANIERLIGHYRPTVKNRIVREHYDGLGFTPIAEHSDGGCDYALDLGSYAPPSLPFAE
jgi:predicted enzyme involved in methoxymalonyl-ACP biosynthesis